MNVWVMIEQCSIVDKIWLSIFSEKPNGQHADEVYILRNQEQKVFDLFNLTDKEKDKIKHGSFAIRSFDPIKLGEFTDSFAV